MAAIPTFENSDHKIRLLGADAPPTTAQVSSSGYLTNAIGTIGPWRVNGATINDNYLVYPVTDGTVTLTAEQFPGLEVMAAGPSGNGLTLVLPSAQSLATYLGYDNVRRAGLVTYQGPIARRTSFEFTVRGVASVNIKAPAGSVSPVGAYGPSTSGYRLWGCTAASPTVPVLTNMLPNTSYRLKGTGSIAIGSDALVCRVYVECDATDQPSFLILTGRYADNSV